MFRIVALLLLIPASVLAGPIDDQVVRPYVEIQTNIAIGSGVVIDFNGEQVVLTAKHVVEGAETIVLVKIDEDDDILTKWKCDVVSICETADLAMVKPRKATGLTSAKICFDLKLERGEDCWYIGSHSRIHGSLEKSIINRPSFETESAYGGQHKYTLVNGNGWYGNSGGPLFVKRGDDYLLVGIVVQLAVLNPRTPIACERLEAIKEYIGG